MHSRKLEIMRQFEMLFYKMKKEIMADFHCMLMMATSFVTEW